MLKDHNAVTPVRLEPAALWSRVKGSTTEPLRSLFMLLLLSADFFSKFIFSKNLFKNTIRVSNNLDPDQDTHSVGPDLGPICLD